MRRIYLGKNGEVVTPTVDERSHYGMAKTILGPSWKGDADDAYTAMWNVGWVRVVETENEVFAEQYADGRSTLQSQLTHSQVKWLESKMLEGKKIFWNSNVFESTREGRPLAGRIDLIVDALLK